MSSDSKDPVITLNNPKHQSVQLLELHGTLRTPQAVFKSLEVPTPKKEKSTTPSLERLLYFIIFAATMTVMSWVFYVHTHNQGVRLQKVLQKCYIDQGNRMRLYKFRRKPRREFPRNLRRVPGDAY